MQTLDKPIADQRLYDVDCSDLLDDNEIIESVAAPVISDDSAVTFGTPVVNAAPIYYPLTKSWAQIGKAVQVMIEDGELPAGATSMHYPIQFNLTTNINPLVQATVCLNLTSGLEC